MEKNMQTTIIGLDIIWGLGFRAHEVTQDYTRIYRYT